MKNKSRKQQRDDVSESGRKKKSSKVKGAREAGKEAVLVWLCGVQVKRCFIARRIVCEQWGWCNVVCSA